MDFPFTFRFVPAPAHLNPYVNTLTVFETDKAEITDAMPAYSAQLMLFWRGSAEMQFADGTVGHSSAAFLTTPMQRAHDFTIRGPARSIGISITAMGWAALTGIPVNESRDRVLTAHEALPAEMADGLVALSNALRDGDVSEEAALDRMVQLFEKHIKPLRDDHRHLIEVINAWLSGNFNPKVEDLFEAAKLSARQVQRLSKRFFGQPPTQLIKRFRAIRAGTMFADPNLTPEAKAVILDAYFDQAHLIRDLRYYTGRTPRMLESNLVAIGKHTLGSEGYGDIALIPENGEAEDEPSANDSQ